MIDFVQKHKERITLAGVVIAFLLSILIGVYLQKGTSAQRDPEVIDSPRQAQLKTKTQANNFDEKNRSQGMVSYFLKPSPDELLTQLASMENLSKETVNAKFSQLPVLWPAYFFSLEEKEDGRTQLLLDVSEDGFGVVLESEVKLAHYPELRDLTAGEKIWIGGRILAVDSSGTGKIYIETEELRLGPTLPYSQTFKGAEK